MVLNKMTHGKVGFGKEELCRFKHKHHLN